MRKDFQRLKALGLIHRADVTIPEQGCGDATFSKLLRQDRHRDHRVRSDNFE